MPARVVLVEDDPAIGESVRTAFVAHGYDVEWHRTGASAIGALELAPPDLVVLDVGLPDTDGFTICRWLRGVYRALPIVVLTARDAEIDVVVGLDAGATDYVTKPFAMAVLLARVRAHLRGAETSDHDAPLVIGALHVEPAAYTARVAEVPVELRPREFELLVRLARDAGRVVTREQLMADVWDEHWDGSTKTLDMHVLGLRRKVGQAITITAVRGVGYRLDPR
jgi:DNA-binding response OmpR family regulator